MCWEENTFFFSVKAFISRNILIKTFCKALQKLVFFSRVRKRGDAVVVMAEYFGRCNMSMCFRDWKKTAFKLRKNNTDKLYYTFWLAIVSLLNWDAIESRKYTFNDRSKQY